MNTPRKHAEVIHAWASGAEIQWLNNDEWVDTDAPRFSEHLEFRIKPKTVKVWDWFVKYQSGVLGYSTMVNEDEVKRQFTNAAIYQRIDGTEREVEI